MTTARRTALWLAIALCVTLLAAAACQGGDDAGSVGTGAAANSAATPAGNGDADSAATSANATADRVVTGTVTYRERIALPPGAILEVELRDTSKQDVASELISRQVITDPGQVPIAFSLPYSRAEIIPQNTYAVRAAITYADGTLGFINDTAYNVLTNGRPDTVHLVLVLVSEPIIDGSTTTPDDGAAGDWVDVPANVRTVTMEENDGEILLTIVYDRPGGDDCSRPSGYTAERIGPNLSIDLTVQEKRGPDGTPACTTAAEEGTETLCIAGPFTPEQVHRVRVNGNLLATFTPTRDGFGDAALALSPIDRTEIVVLEKFPPAYTLIVYSGLPKGSGCSQFNGYIIERAAKDRIDITVTHHEVTAPNIGCIEDYPTIETTIPLGEAFTSGQTYKVVINATTEQTFTAQ